MNRALKRISIAILAMFLLLLINVNYLQGFETTSLASRPFNIRAVSADNQYQRGDIETADGMKIAGTTPSNDIYKYVRTYANGPAYAPVTGYDSIYSSTGVEHAEALTADARIRLSLDTVELPAPGPDEVVVRIEAAPVNPTDVVLMLSLADLASATRREGVLEAPVAPPIAQAFAARVGQPLTVGSEGAGTIVAAGSGAAAQALLGKTVSAFGGGMFASHRVAHVGLVQPLPPGRSAEEGASAFVNPMTALSFVETMRAEGHRAIVHTAAASNLGHMLIKICAADGVPLVNIVRRPAQVEQLKAAGATYVLDSSAPTFGADLVEAIAATGATIAFDAIGGGTLGAQILGAMEQVARRSMKAFSHYGSSTPKQLYIYGSLDPAPTVLPRTFGMTWDAGGYLVINALRKLGPEVAARMSARVMRELTTTFASHYSHRIGLDRLVDVDTVRAFAKLATGEKYLVVA